MEGLYEVSFIIGVERGGVISSGGEAIQNSQFFEGTTKVQPVCVII